MNRVEKLQEVLDTLNDAFATIDFREHPYSLNDDMYAAIATMEELIAEEEAIPSKMRFKVILGVDRLDETAVSHDIDSVICAGFSKAGEGMRTAMRGVLEGLQIGQAFFDEDGDKWVRVEDAA